MEEFQTGTELKASVIKHFQKRSGYCDDFRQIIDRLTDDEIIDCMLSWPKKEPLTSYQPVSIVSIPDCIGKPVAFKSHSHYFLGMLSSVKMEDEYPILFYATLNGVVHLIDETFEIRLLE